MPYGMSKDNNILSARRLFKAYYIGDSKIDVLIEVNLNIDRGESVSIRGESGCGKTTLLNILAGIERPNSGAVNWKGKNIFTQKPAQMADWRSIFFGIIFQSYYLIPELNALENVYMPARIRGELGIPEENRAHNLLERVGLRKRMKSSATTLSGGERQRVAIARALMNKPAVIFADEPTGNLDEKNGEGIMDLILDICEEENTALVLVTHNKKFANRTDRQFSLHESKLENIS